MKPLLRTGTLAFTALALAAPTAWAEGAGPIAQSVPAGIVFPAFQDATVQNPAMLRAEDAFSAQVDFAPVWNGNSGSFGAGAAWGNGKFGLGATLQGSSSASYDYDSLTGLVSNQQWGLTDLVIGASMGTGSLAAGANFTFPLNQNWSSRTDLAIRMGKGNGLTSAFVLHNLDSLTSSAALEAGIGWAQPENFSVEGHVTTPSFGTLSTGYYEIGGNVVLHIRKLGLGFGAQTYTGTSGGSNGFGSEISATYWLGKSIEILAKFDSNFAPTFGLTWAMGGK